VQAGARGEGVQFVFGRAFRLQAQVTGFRKDRKLEAEGLEAWALTFDGKRPAVVAKSASAADDFRREGASR
jgi:hypothetical protein